jgi:hypothetical protein
MGSCFANEIGQPSRSLPEFPTVAGWPHCNITSSGKKQSDVLRYLASGHDALRVPEGDGSRPRWPSHPLRTDVQARIAELPARGVIREIGLEGAMDELLQRIAMSICRCCKRVATVVRLRMGRRMLRARKPLNPRSGLSGECMIR